MKNIVSIIPLIISFLLIGTNSADECKECDYCGMRCGVLDRIKKIPCDSVNDNGCCNVFNPLRDPPQPKTPCEANSIEHTCGLGHCNYCGRECELSEVTDELQKLKSDPLYFIDFVHECKIYNSKKDCCLKCGKAKEDNEKKLIQDYCINPVTTTPNETKYNCDVDNCHYSCTEATSKLTYDCRVAKKYRCCRGCKTELIYPSSSKCLDRREDICDFCRLDSDKNCSIYLQSDYDEEREDTYLACVYTQNTKECCDMDKCIIIIPSTKPPPMPMPVPDPPTTVKPKPQEVILCTEEECRILCNRNCDEGDVKSRTIFYKYSHSVSRPRTMGEALTAQRCKEVQANCCKKGQFCKKETLPTSTTIIVGHSGFPWWIVFLVAFLVILLITIPIGCYFGRKYLKERAAQVNPNPIVDPPGADIEAATSPSMMSMASTLAPSISESEAPDDPITNATEVDADKISHHHHHHRRHTDARKSVKQAL